MRDIGNPEPNTESQRAGVQQAADELAVRLKALADTLASTTTPQRVPYGSGRFGQYLRRRSPEGFVLNSTSLQVLLPDGRLWTYSRNDSVRYPEGRFFDACVDYSEFAAGRSLLGGRAFVFLGAALGKYSFGWAAAEGLGRGSDSGGLYAIRAEGNSVRYFSADEAIRAIAATFATR